MRTINHPLKYLLIHLIAYHCYGDEMSWVQQACSAMDSYLSITIASRELTVPSTQALFPPNAYYIPSIPITILSDWEDTPCGVDQISTDLTNTMVLLYTNAQCSDHYQVYVAEQNGAIAVLMSSNGNTQQSIPGNSELNTSIPVRGITRDVADIITRQLSDLAESVSGSFACDSTEHPLSVCVVDAPDGANWYLDGEYIRKSDDTFNAHPIWHKPGYYLLDYYIYLHTALWTDGWFWAITSDPTFTADAAVRAYCSLAGDDIKEPSDCPLWRNTNGTNLGQLGQYKATRNFTVSAEVCIFEDRYICVESTQSSLAGLQGTYRLNHNNVPIWFREMDECDGTPGMLKKDTDGSLILYDAVDGWTVGRCNGSIADSFIAFTPQTCTPWDTLVDNSLDNDEMNRDGTVSITMDACDQERCFITEAPADRLCLSNNTVLHSFLEGTYVQSGVSGDNEGFVEYTKAEPLFDEDGEPIKSYLWYFGEFSDQFSWWILTPQNLTYALESDGYGVGYYGYTACSVQNVLNCRGPWNFFWGVTGASHSDASFRITDGDCPAPTPQPPPDYGDEYEYICVDVVDRDAFAAKSALNVDQFRGGYQIKRDDRDIPYWVKPINDYTEAVTYIYYEEAYRYWRIDISLYDEDNITSTGMICMSDVLYPDQCDRWYDTMDGRVLNSVMALRVNGCGFSDVLERSCSAMHSWLELSGYVDITLTSSQTLFAPFFYRTKPTELVRLDPDENPCVLDQIETDVAGKMVLLFTSSLFLSDVSCSDHYQLYIMEQLNATAVIMSSRDNTLEPIPDDDAANIRTTIPMRGISLYKAVDIAAALDAGETIYGAFSCNDSFQYPITICASQVGLDIYGNFEYQSHVKFNGHPVWIREGYSVYTAYQDTYLYLHNGNGDNPWYWAISMDDDLSDDDEMIAYCNDGTVAIHAMECNEWMVLQSSDDDEDDIGWQSSGMQTYDGLCNVSDSYFCITSEQSSFAGLEGTYRLYYEDEPVWFRERDACDHNPGVFAYTDGTFYLLDPMDSWIVASCAIGERLPWLDDEDWAEYERHFAFHPELCTVWYTLDDSTLNDYQSYDDTVLIQQNAIQCGDTAQCINSGVVPDTLCMTQNSVMHSFLEGTYTATGEVGDIYGTKEYVRSEALFYDGDKINAFLWFYGEIPGKSPWWIISNHNMSVGIEQSYAIAFGYAACSLQNPAKCRGPWNFYYGSQPGKGNWHADAQFAMNEDECAAPDITPANYTEDYEYLCITSLDEEYNASHIYKGAYKINRTSTEFSGDTPFWVKPPNDYYAESIYIYYDEFYGYWQIGKSLEIEHMLVCMGDTQYPELCGKWYDDNDNAMTYTLAFRSEDCSAEDMLGITANPKPHGALIALIVVLIVVLVFGLCIAGYCVYDKCLEKRGADRGGYNNHNINSTEMGTVGGKGKKKKKQKTKRGHTQLAIGSDEDEDGALTGATARGGYDMNPLQREKRSSSDEDESEGESTDDRLTREGPEDQQENDIHDEEDGMLIN